MQRSTKNILYCYADTIYTSETAQGLDIGSTIGTRTELFPWWWFIIVGMYVAATAGCAVWLIMLIKKYKYKRAA